MSRGITIGRLPRAVFDRTVSRSGPAIEGLWSYSKKGWGWVDGYFGFVANPGKCTTEGLPPHTPGVTPLEESEKIELLKAQYSGAVQLVAHDDVLNWQKFYNMVYVNLGLLAAYGLVLQASQPNRLFLAVVALAGVLTGLGFRFTLKEGVNCLKQHKEKVDWLDEVFSEYYNRPRSRFLFHNNRQNRRELLWCGPILTIGLWVFLALLPIFLAAKPPLTARELVAELSASPLSPAAAPAVRKGNAP